MGKLETDTDSQYEAIDLEQLNGASVVASSNNNESKASSSSSSSSSSPSNVSTSLGRKKWSLNKVEPSNNSGSSAYNSNYDGVYRAKDFDQSAPPSFLSPPQAPPSSSEDHVRKPVPFYKLFQFSSTQDKLLLAVGILAAMCGGCTLPVMIKLFGDLTNAFVTNGFASSSNSTEISCQNNDTSCDTFFDHITKFGLGTSTIGLINFVMAYIFVTSLNHAAECQAHRIRGLFFKSVLRQDIGWYDTHQTADFASRMAEDLNKLQEGMGEKIGMFIFFMTIFSASLINAFYHGWELTLVMMAAMPVLMIATAIIAGSQTALTEKEFAAYSKAGSIAEEALSAIRTVAAFSGQDKEVERYESKLVYARRAGMLRGFLTGVGGGLFWFLVYSSYALAIWYGVKLIMDDRESCQDNDNCQPRYDPSSFLIVFFSVLMGAMNVGQATPYVEAFSMARGAATNIFTVIERKPPIDSLSEGGLRPVNSGRTIVFTDVHFNYPARSDIPILRGLSLTINKGETVALVGPSGCGKSTCIQLVQRFYDPAKGKVELGGHDLRQLNVGWLRERIGVVGQEPVLFGCTIAENIRYGRDDVTVEAIEKACRAANAYDFIAKLPKKFDTLVGERGAQLSGGQKQRLAIARALVRDPEILLLDEATSALDTQSESIVQSALDQARAGRTTIIVAHRLSTIRTADKIVAIKDGFVEEIGTHEELMRNESLYHSLVMAQVSNDEELAERAEEDDVVEDLELVEQSLPSLISLTSHSGNNKQLQRKRSKAKIERKISVSSIMSEDSFSIDHLEEVGQAIGAAVGLTKVSLRESRRRKSMSRQDSINPEPEDEGLPKISTWRIIKTNGPEWPFITLGSLASIIMGASMPVYAYIFGEVLGTLSKDVETARIESAIYSIAFLILGVVVGFAMFFQIAMFTVAGEHLTMRMRKMAFAAMLKQEMAWFDQPSNNTGALCSRLSADAAAIQGVTGNRAGALLQSIFTIVLAICAGIFTEWRLGLVGACYVPLLLVSSTFQAKIIASHDNIEKEALASSAKLAIEAITNIRTVAGLGREKTFVQKYMKELDASHREAKRKSHIRGLVFGFAQSMPFFAYAGCMYYGGYLVDKGELEYQRVYKVAEALILGTMMVGQATAFAPNYNKAVLAAARVFRLLDRRPLIDSQGQTGLRLNRLDGNVDFQKATFRYPTRAQVRVLRDLDLTVNAGQRVALVGPSGCGKSTCIQLLQRFYDLKSGELTLDGLNIESVNVPNIRRQLGIVSQEPVLFDRTIAENIMYGDNERIVSMEQVVEAAKMANIHSFIASLPQGYDTRVGEKGTQLSGGQKQRVAIARALVRNPSILLLDEATSALDTESEKVVQEALDKAQEGRTSITIAHRLSTVQNMDKIFVISHGRVTEAGTHAQLLTQKGLYAKLWSKQAGSPK